MSTPPTPTINLDSPKECYDVDDIHQWNHDSTESAKNGTLQEWITEPLQMLTSSSSTSSQSTNNVMIAPTPAPAAVEDKNGLTVPSSSSNGTDQLLSSTASGLNQLNKLATIPETSISYHQLYSVPVNTNGHQLAVPGTSNGQQYQLPTPGTGNGASYRLYNHGFQYASSNGIVEYSPNFYNGAHMMSARPPAHIVHPVRPNGGFIMNGGNGYANGMVNGRFIRPGWVNTTNKIVNGVKKQKRNRTAFTSHQMMELEQEYAKARYLDRTRRIELSETLHLNQRTIKIWFQNRRMKEKKDRLEDVSTSDSPPVNINELPVFVQDGSYMSVGLENPQYSSALYADSMTMPAMPQAMSQAMSQSMPLAMPQMHQVPDVPYFMENDMQPYNPDQPNNHQQQQQVQAQQPPMVLMNGGLENAPNAEENWDLSWIRSMSDDLELA